MTSVSNRTSHSTTDKQLPLRQQRDKPVLKYNALNMPSSNGANKPQQPRPPAVPLFNHADIHLHKQQADSYEIYNNIVSATSNGYITKVAPQFSYSGYTFLSGPGTPNGTSLTPAHILASNLGRTSKPSKNLYARPVSAKEMQSSQKPVSALGSFGYGSRQTGSDSNLGSYYDGITGGAASQIQTNSFMRPQSAVNNGVAQNPSQKPVSALGSFEYGSRQTGSDSNLGSYYDEINGGEASQIQTNSFMRPQSAVNNGVAQNPSQNLHNKTSTSCYNMPTAFRTQKPGSQQTNCTVTEQRDSVLQKKPPKPPSKPYDQRPVSAIKRSVTVVTGHYGAPALLPQDTVKAVDIDGPVEAYVRDNSVRTPVTNSVASVSNCNRTDSIIRPGTPAAEVAAKVRNLCYTPSRPYSEVSSKVTNDNRSDSPHVEDVDVTENGSAKLVADVNSNKIQHSATALPKSDIPNPAARARSHEMPSGPAATAITAKLVTKDNVGNKPRFPARKSPVPPSSHPHPSSAGLQRTLSVQQSGNLRHRAHLNHTSSDQMISGQRMRKMPVTNTITPTVYYRKSSKAEEVVRSVRREQLVDGARMTTETKPVEKKQEEDAEEWEDTEEDDEDDQSRAGTVSERMPTYGEDLDNEDEDDDDVIDTIGDDDVEGESDDESYTSSVVSRQSSAACIRSATKRMLGLSIHGQSGDGRVSSVSKSRPTTAKSRCLSAYSTASSDSDLEPALMTSLFPNIPPTINFVVQGEKVEKLPWEIRKYLKWRLSPITPIVVKNCIARSYFRITRKNHDWLGYWGKHMKSEGFRDIKEYQKVNHFPGSFQIGRKDRLWRNLSKMQLHCGKKEFSFFPQTFVLPFDFKLLKRAWEDGGSKQKWIIKPPASARGIGIRVVHKWNQIPKRRPVIVQRYLSKPFLINDSKFDIRLYVYVTSYDPLRVYLYDDGLARFASVKYSNSVKSLSNKYMHMTNYSINKKNPGYESNTDENICQGHKWGLKALWGYMKKRGINSNAVWENIKDLVIKTIISCESGVNSLMKANVKRRFSCHELFGFDVFLDDNLKPWIIEVNISPSLHSNSQLDVNIKGGMIKDLMNLSAFMIPSKHDLREHVGPSEFGKYQVPSEICMDKRLWPTTKSPDERAKHAYYCQRYQDEFMQSTILDILTAEDVRILTETIDEDSRRGNFQRIFPSPSSHKYLRFFEQPRYYNQLLDQWIQKYNRMEARGISYLDTLCAKGIHLENPTSDPNHQWSPPKLTIPRDNRAFSAPSTPQVKQGMNNALPKLKKKAVKSTTHCNSLPGVTSTCSTPMSTTARTLTNDTS